MSGEYFVFQQQKRPKQIKFDRVWGKMHQCAFKFFLNYNTEKSLAYTEYMMMMNHPVC